MKCEGYKLSGYDATYRKAVFNVNDKGNRVLEVSDIDSGETFLLDFNSLECNEKGVRSWRNDETGKNYRGISITFGSKGLFEELMYGGKKRKG